MSNSPTNANNNNANTTETDLVTQLSTEIAVLLGGSPNATIEDTELPMVFAAFPEGCFSEALTKSVFQSAKVPVGQGLDAHQLVRVCRALEQTTHVSTVSLLEAICAAAFHRVFVMIDENGGGVLDEKQTRELLEAFGATSSQIAAVRANGIRDNIFADEIGKVIRMAIAGNFAKMNSMAKAMAHIQASNSSFIGGGGGGGARRQRGATVHASVVNVTQQPTDPTYADLVTMLDLRQNGGANMKDVADACYAALPIPSAAKIGSVLNRTIELANGALLDEVALKTFIEHHLAQYVPGFNNRQIVRALIDGTCMKFLAVAGCLAIAGQGALIAVPGSSQDSRHRPLVLTPYLEALGFSRSQITSSYQATVSVNDALRRIFKNHQSKQPGAMKTFLSHRGKVQARAGPRHNPPPPGSEEESRLFIEVFTLLDSRSLAVLNLDNVMEFLEPIPNAPDPSIINKLFDSVDKEQSGNIDRDAFKTLLQELDRAKVLSFGNLLQCFREFAYRKMFEIADKDGGGTIDKQELRMVMDCIGATQSEIAKVSSDMPNELSLDEFSTIIAPFSRGKSLSVIIETGNRMQKQASAAKSAMKLFQGAANRATGKDLRGQALPEASGADGKPRSLADVAVAAQSVGASENVPKRMCFGCAELDATISTLTAQIESLKVDLSKSEYAQDNARSGSADSGGEDSRGASAEATGETPAEVIDDLLRGDLYKGMRAFENIPAAVFYKKYPQLSKSFIHQISSERVRRVMTSLTVGAKEGLAAAHRFTEEHKKKVEDVMEQLNVDIEMIAADIKEFFSVSLNIVERVSNPTNIDKEAVQYKLVDLNAARQKIQAMESDLQWITEKVIEWSQEAIDLAVVAAPFSSRISDVLNNLLFLDTSTIGLVENLVLIAFISSSQPTDAEVWARRVLSGTHVCIPEEEVPALKQFIQQTENRLGATSFWDKLRKDYLKAFSHLHRALSRSTAMKKDKAIYTQGNASYTYSLRALKNREGGPGGSTNKPRGEHSPDHPAFTEEGEEEVVVLSPRHRHRRPEITDPIKYVDRLLREIRERQPDIPIPQNFRRIAPEVNTFWFNERIIDLIPNDNNCVVKVGGGYVMFEEYCSKYGRSGPEGWNNYAQLGISGHLMGGNSAGGSPGISGGTTPRNMYGHSGSGGSGMYSARSGMNTGRSGGRATTPGASPRGMNTSTNNTGTMTTPRRVLIRQGRGVILH